MKNLNFRGRIEYSLKTKEVDGGWVCKRISNPVKDWNVPYKTQHDWFRSDIREYIDVYPSTRNPGWEYDETRRDDIYLYQHQIPFGSPEKILISLCDIVLDDWEIWDKSRKEEFIEKWSIHPIH